MKEDYFELIELSEEKLEGEPTTVKEADVETKESVEKEIKTSQEKKLKEILGRQVESMTRSISASVQKILSEVSKMEDGTVGEAKVNSLKSDLHALDKKIDGAYCNIFTQYAALLEEPESSTTEDQRKSFVNTRRQEYILFLHRLHE